MPNTGPGRGAFCAYCVLCILLGGLRRLRPATRLALQPEESVRRDLRQTSSRPAA